MGDLVSILNHFNNLSPVNTALIVALGFFIKWAVKGIFTRLDALESSMVTVKRRNRKQNAAIRRLEQQLKLEPIRYDDDEDDDE